MILGTLPLRGGCSIEGGRRLMILGDAPSARGCSIGGRKMMFLGALPLRVAARLREGEVVI